MLAEWNIPAIVQDETLGAVEIRWPVLLRQIAGIVAVGGVDDDVGEGFAPGIGSLQRQPVGELFANRDLQAVVVGDAIEGGGLEPSRSVTDVRHAETDIGYGGGG